MAVAGIPLAAGITGDAYRDPTAFNDGFRMAMWISAVLAASGAVLAAITFRVPAAVPVTAATEPKPSGPARPVHLPAGNRHCALEAPPLSSCPGSTGASTGPSAA
jgi:hypothetical protein